MQHRTLARAMLIGVAALGAWTATELADDHAAHADAKPPAVTVDRPGGLVDRAAKLHRLPQQASARAKAAVAKMTAEPTPEPSTPAEPEPEPAPSDEPTEPTPPVEDKPRTEPTPPVEAPPVDEPPVELPPVELPLPTPTEPLPVPVELPSTPLPPVELPPLPAPPPSPAPVPAPPVVDVPDPLPTSDVPDPQLPVPAPAPVVVPDVLPVAIGPVPAAEPPPTTVVDQLIAELTAGTAQVIPCDDTAHPQDSRTQRDNADRQPGKPTPTVSDRSPCRPHLPAVNTTGAGQVKPPPPSAADLIVADLIGSHVPPALGRLEHARARSTIPASRHVAIEPGPA